MLQQENIPDCKNVITWGNSLRVSQVPCKDMPFQGRRKVQKSGVALEIQGTLMENVLLLNSSQNLKGGGRGSDCPPPRPQSEGTALPSV